MPSSSWTESGTAISLVPSTTPVISGAPESPDYLTNADKIDLMAQYAAELATETQLDTTASSLSVSSTFYDNAVAAISTALINAGAPANWATTWPDGTTSGPWPNIQTSLANLWAQVATQRTALQSVISNAQAAAAQTAAIAAAATDATNKMNAAITAVGLAPVVVSSLPTLPSATYPSGRLVWNTADGQLYRSTGTAWTVLAVAAADISGTLSAAQIASLAASQVTGQLSDTQLAAISAAKVTGTISAAQIASGAVGMTQLASGIRPTRVVSALPVSPWTGYATGDTVVLTTDNKLYRFTGATWTTAVATSDLSGTVTAAQIASVAASQVTGTLSDSQLAAISAAKLTGAVGSGNLLYNCDFAYSSGGIPSGFAVYNNGSISVSPSVSAGGPLGSANYWRITANAAVTSTFGFYFTSAATDFGGWKANTNYVVSFYARVSANPSGCTMTDGWNNAPATVSWLQNPVLTTQWQRYAVGINFGTNAIDANGFFTIAPPTLPSGNYIDFSCLQVEQGDAPSGWSGPITASTIAANTITANQIAAGTITAAQIAADTITASQIAANAITSSELAAGAVVAGKIAAGTIQAGDIAAATITGANIAANTITGSNIAADTITAGQIAAGGITASELAAGAVTAASIAASTITGSNIAAGTITGSNLVADTITATQIAASAITSSELAAGAVVAGKIAAGTIQAGDIAAGTITGDRLAANTVTASQIAANTITAGQLAANTITAGQIAAGAIGATQIAANAITAKSLTLTNFDNLIPNPNSSGEMSNGTAWPTGSWESAGLGVAGGANSSFFNPPSQGYCRIVNGNSAGNTPLFIGPSITCKPGESYQWSCNAYNLAGNVASGMWLNVCDAYGVAQAWPGTSVTANGTISGTYTVPATLGNGNPPATIQPYVNVGPGTGNNTGLFNFFQLKRMSDASLIVDGSITASKIAAGAITADMITTGTLNAANVAVTNLNASNITTGTLSANMVLFPDGTELSTANRVQTTTKSQSTSVALGPSDTSVFGTQYGTGTCTTNGTTSTVSANSGTFNSGMVGARIGINNVAYTIATYVNSTQITVSGIPPATYNTVFVVYSVAGLSITTAGGSDTINLQCMLSIQITGAATTITANVSVDGGASMNPVSAQLSSTAGTYSVPYFTSITGLNAGAHTISINVHSTASGVNAVSVYVLAMRIF